MSHGFLSPLPEVKLTKAFTTPFRNVVATAKTCYSSKGIIGDDQVGEPEKFNQLAQSIYEAGHHTTYQHAHFQFAISNVSRQFIWDFLHSHPFYNSEQVSQRYVPMKHDGMAIPDLGNPMAQEIFSETVDVQFKAYGRLCELLEPSVEEAFFDRFNRSERQAKSHKSTIKKKAMEIARYVLPLATHAYLYHTISAITLFRYWRVANAVGVPTETRLVIKAMVDEVLRHDPEYQVILQEPLREEVFAEYQYYLDNPDVLDGVNARYFRRDFDIQMGDQSHSRLVGFVDGAEGLVADAVKEVLCASNLSTEEAIALAMNPARNPILGEALNLTTLDKLSRAMYHAHYTFRKRLSHTADSQDQRHRMTPASRPVLMAHCDDEPDFITPPILELNEEARSLYQDTMEYTWEAIGKLWDIGVAPEQRIYLLPNSVVVRFTESADLLNLRHKHVMRLCYNAQEEIWKASVEEASQIRTLHPLIGRYLLPPCSLRSMAKTKPICPEGERYCGVMVWKKDLSEYERLI